MDSKNSSQSDESSNDPSRTGLIEDGKIVAFLQPTSSLNRSIEMDHISISKQIITLDWFCNYLKPWTGFRIGKGTDRDRFTCKEEIWGLFEAVVSYTSNIDAKHCIHLFNGAPQNKGSQSLKDVFNWWRVLEDSKSKYHVGKFSVKEKSKKISNYSRNLGNLFNLRNKSPHTLQISTMLAFVVVELYIQRQQQVQDSEIVNAHKAFKEKQFPNIEEFIWKLDFEFLNVTQQIFQASSSICLADSYFTGVDQPMEIMFESKDDTCIMMKEISNLVRHIEQKELKFIIAENQMIRAAKAFQTAKNKCIGERQELAAILEEFFEIRNQIQGTSENSTIDPSKNVSDAVKLIKSLAGKNPDQFSSVIKELTTSSKYIEDPNKEMIVSPTSITNGSQDYGHVKHEDSSISFEAMAGTSNKLHKEMILSSKICVGVGNLAIAAKSALKEVTRSIKKMPKANKKRVKAKTKDPFGKYGLEKLKNLTEATIRTDGYIADVDKIIKDKTD